MSERRGIADQLWDLLPTVYRARDGETASGGPPGDLRAFLEASGVLLDRIRQLLEQRHSDALPTLESSAAAGQGADGMLEPQDWLLPYLARLFAARLLSPHVDGRRAELSRAISWRQLKGTLRAVEEIAEAVGRLEVEIQEGWRRVALTPHLGLRELPYAVVDTRTPDRFPTFSAAAPAENRPTRPALPPRTCPYRGHRASQLLTVDVRNPDWRRGHAHPRRLLLFSEPPCGFFSSRAEKVDWQDALQDSSAHTFLAKDEEGRLCLCGAGMYEKAEGLPRVRPTPEYTVVVESPVVLDGAAGRPRAFLGVVFAGEVQIVNAEILFRNVAAKKTQVIGNGGRSALYAKNCLFDDLIGRDSEITLEYCTVMKQARLDRIRASDCVFRTAITGDVAALPASTADRTERQRESCLRYSRVEAGPFTRGDRTPVPTMALTSDVPVFFALRTADAPAATVPGEFGSPGYAVLHPATPDAVRFGAEDGGEMGAYHDFHHAVGGAAVLEKLTEFLPLGLTAVLIPDESLIGSRTEGAGNASEETDTP